MTPTETVPAEVLLCFGRLRRTRGIVRGRGATRNVGRSRGESLEYPIPLWATMGKRGASVSIPDASALSVNDHFAILRKPFPANLMLGFYATADPAQPIRTDLDNELEGDQFRYTSRTPSLIRSWFPFLRRQVVHPRGGSGFP